MSALVPFDYSSIDEVARDDVRDAAVRIKVRMSRTAADIIEIGNDLIAVKSALGHGHFLKWIETEFGMSDDSAGRFMAVAQRLGDKIPHTAEFTPSVLYALAAPSTPEAVVNEAVERANEGEKITASEIRAMKDAWAAEKRDLRAKAEDAKARAARADALKLDYEQQVLRARSDMEKLRDQIGTLEHELSDKQTVGQAPLEDAYPQWAAIMDNLWAMASDDWRSRWKRASLTERIAA